MPAESHRLPSLSVVFPAFNDAGTIASMVVAARRAARRLTDDFEILVVDDGSEDSTPDTLAELEELVPELRVIRHPRNLGYGAALRAGFSSATKELVFYTDGDAQFDPRELSFLAARLDPGIHCVNGYRTRRADPLLRVLLGRPYHWLVREAFGVPLRDVDCDFRLVRRGALQGLELSETNGALSIELLRKLADAGCRFREVPVSHYPRVYGRSQYYTPRRVLSAYVQLFRLWWRLVVRKNPIPQAVSARDERKLAP